MSSSQNPMEDLGNEIASNPDDQSMQCLESLMDIIKKITSLFTKHQKLKSRTLALPFAVRNFDDTEPLFGYKATPEFIKNGTLRDYQVEGVNWMISLYWNGVNGILADEMGLGKTVQTITFLGYLKHESRINGPFLIVVPKSTLQNWMAEIEHWCPSLKALLLIGDKKERGSCIRDHLRVGTWDVCLTSYEIVVREKAKLQRIAWAYVVLDEGHRIKNEDTQVAKVLRSFKAKHFLLLTGTPLQNNLHELWSLLNFIMPDLFDSATRFDKWFNVQSNNANECPIQRLQTVLKAFVLRRFKADVESSLLPKEEIKVMVGLTSLQRQMYKSILSKNMELLGPNAKLSRVSLENVIMNLRKCTNHPYLFEGVEQGPTYSNDMHLVTSSGKMIILDKLLLKLKGQGSRVLLFSQMVRMLDILEDYCSFRDFEFCRLDGSTDYETRGAEIQRFNAPDSTVFLFMLSTRAGGVGINLASADSVIIFDSDWNPQMDLQAINRAHRIGQKKKVRVFRLVTENTVEEMIVERADYKKSLDTQLLTENSFVQDNQGPGSSSEQLLNIIRFGSEHFLRNEEHDAHIDLDLESVLERSSKLNTPPVLGQNKENANTPEDLSTPPPTHSLYKFEGKNYQGIKPEEVGQRSAPLAPRRSSLRTGWSTFGIKWDEADFNQFIQAIVEYGSNDVVGVVRSMSHKPSQEVRQFYKMFWRRWSSLPNYEELKQRFERTDRKFERLRRFARISKDPERGVLPHATEALKTTPGYMGNGQLCKFQLQGAVWILSNLKGGRNVLLNDQAGLGKTVQAIMVIAYYKFDGGEQHPHLLIVPTHLIAMWQLELSKWCPSLIVRTIRIPDDRTELDGKTVNKTYAWDVCLTTYDMIAGSPDMFVGITWTLVVFDEAQLLAAADETLCSTLNELKNDRRLLVSGETYLRTLSDYRGIYNALFPDVWGSAEEFMQWIQPQVRKKRFYLIEAMPLLKTPVIRRKTFLISDPRKPPLPQREVLLEVALKPNQRRIYRRLMAKLRETKKGDVDAKKALFSSLMQCLQHPYLVECDGLENVANEDMVASSAKLSKLDELLARLKSENARVLLCTKSPEMLNILECYLQWRQYKCCIVKSNDAYEKTQHFDAPNCEDFIFVMASDQDYMNGLGVTTVDTVICYDLHWNFSRNNLVFTRACRLGIERSLKIYRLTTSETCEEFFLHQVLRRKHKSRCYDVRERDIDIILEKYDEEGASLLVGEKRAGQYPIKWFFPKRSK